MCGGSLWLIVDFEANKMISLKTIVFFVFLSHGLVMMAVSSAKIEMIDKLTTKRTIKRFKDRKDLQLVMSDEFETSNRRFDKGQDKFFESITKPDETNNAMQFCKSSFRSFLFFSPR
jgi:hypothetical protein